MSDKIGDYPTATELKYLEVFQPMLGYTPEQRIECIDALRQRFMPDGAPVFRFGGAAGSGSTSPAHGRGGGYSFGGSGGAGHARAANGEITTWGETPGQSYRVVQWECPDCRTKGGVADLSVPPDRCRKCGTPRPA